MTPREFGRKLRPTRRITQQSARWQLHQQIKQQPLLHPDGRRHREFMSI